MKLKFFLKKSGISILEAMIALAILSVIIALSTILYSWNQKQIQESQQRGLLLNALRTLAGSDLCKSLQLGVDFLQNAGGALPPSSYDVSVTGKISPPLEYSGTKGIADAFANVSSLPQTMIQIVDYFGNPVAVKGFLIRLRPNSVGGLNFLKFEYIGDPPRIVGTLDFTTWGDPLGIATNKRFLANVFVNGQCDF